MTLVTIDIKNVASETHPDDRVVFYSPTFREAPGGGITSTAETVVPLVDGVGEKELAPGPVTVTFQCRGIADTRPKSGVVPDAGPVGIEEVIANAFEYAPEVVNRGLEKIEDARDDAIGQVDVAVASKTDAIKWRKDYTALGSTALNDVLTQGLWSQWDSTQVTTAKNYPPDTGAMTLEVILLGGGTGWATQTAKFIDSGNVWSRSFKGGVWSAWRRVDGIPVITQIAAGTDWDTLRTAGMYRRGTTTSHVNAPVTAAGVLQVFDATGAGNSVIQLFQAHGGQGVFWRSRGQQPSGEWAWSLWARLDQPVFQIAAGTDWDTLRTAGMYRRGSSSTDVNAPTTTAGVLTVTDATGASLHVMQLWQAHNGEGIWWRSRGQQTGGVWQWSEWARLDRVVSPTTGESYGPAMSYGDSITWANGYQPIVMELLGLQSYGNRGVSGRPMSDGSANGPGTVTTILASSDHATYDLVTIAAGTNDFKLNMPLGSIGVLTDTTFDRTTFYGAYRTALDYLLQQAPNLRIVLMTPLKRNNSGYTDESTNTAGHMLRDYRSAILALGEMYSLPVIDLYATSGFNKWTLPTWTDDGLHPNATGYPFMARAIAGQLKTVMALEAV